MEKIWRLILDEACEPHANMAIDEALMLFQKEGSSRPTLRIYKWLYPCVSIGRFQNLDEALSWAGGLDLVRRPTGGGAVFHDEFSFTYSIIYQERACVLPKGVLDSYRQIHVGILNAVKSLGLEAAFYMPQETGPKSLTTNICFCSPVKYDIVCGGKKIAGAAQRRRHGVVLHQGEVGLNLDVWPEWSYNILKNAIIASLSKQLEAKFVAGCLSEEEKKITQEIAGSIFAQAT